MSLYTLITYPMPYCIQVLDPTKKSFANHSIFQKCNLQPRLARKIIIQFSTVV